MHWECPSPPGPATRLQDSHEFAVVYYALHPFRGGPIGCSDACIGAFDGVLLNVCFAPRHESRYCSTTSATFLVAQPLVCACISHLDIVATMPNRAGFCHAVYQTDMREAYCHLRGAWAPGCNICREFFLLLLACSERHAGSQPKLHDHQDAGIQRVRRSLFIRPCKCSRLGTLQHIFAGLHTTLHPVGC